ncbi:probable transcription factor At1g11510 [Camellia sinensis]|uniref:probable transcription factor At1g11510 n=1 Tax=Camellia sinensis TaxID=4442 RepID=UPI0010368F32|nr:probable transcription factor At1g11510 [Camellia sinensis]
MSTITTTNQIFASSRRRKPYSASATAAESPENPTLAASKSPSRRVLFTEQDEIHLLKALKRANKLSSSAVASPPPPLSGVIGGDFSDVQITDKLRRLRQRYHKLARTKSLMKTPRDRKIYEMGRKIWGKKLKNSRRESKSVEDGGFEGEVDLSDFPALLREVSGIFPENRVYREGLERLGREKLMSLNEKWMVQRMEEAGLLAKKAELFYEQTKLELQSSVVSM